MLIRLAYNNKPYYLNSDYILSVEGETSGSDSLATIRMRNEFEDNDGVIAWRGVYYTNTTADKVVAEINRQLHIAAIKKASIPDEIAFRKG